jgi:hypothetical protein
VPQAARVSARHRCLRAQRKGCSNGLQYCSDPLSSLQAWRERQTRHNTGLGAGLQRAPQASGRTGARWGKQTAWQRGRSWRRPMCSAGTGPVTADTSGYVVGPTPEQAANTDTCVCCVLRCRCPRCRPFPKNCKAGNGLGRFRVNRKPEKQTWPIGGPLDPHRTHLARCQRFPGGLFLPLCRAKAFCARVRCWHDSSGSGTGGFLLFFARQTRNGPQTPVVWPAAAASSPPSSSAHDRGTV